MKINEDNTIEFSGYEGEIITILAKYMNFTLNVIDCNWNWGIWLNNGSWTGLVAHIVNKVIFHLIINSI